jgi:mevalonate kinase
VNNLHQLSKTFHGKLLLAGEYTVIDGGSSLALPLTKYSAYLTRDGKSNHKDMWNTMYQHFKDNELDLNYTLFEEDIVMGLGYQSDIPTGYGVGSSGALVASMYDRYQVSERNEKELQALLAKMENYFHGSSSGIDPFVIYTNKTVLTKEGKNFITDANPNLRNWYLLDSGIARSTATFVDVYKKSIRSQNKVKIQYLQRLNEDLIGQILNNEINVDTIFEISYTQFDLFKPMITAHVMDIWKEGLDSKSYFMKLCGAGGGGFFLVYSESIPKNIKHVMSLN